MTRLRRRAALALAVLQSWAMPLAAQEKTEKRGGVVTTVEVDILSLDVLAVDKKDRPILGLKQEDFEVRIAGKAQPFEFFEAARGPSRRGGADSPEHFVGTVESVRPDGQPSPHVLVFVDLEQLPKGAIREAATAIQETTGRAAGSARIGLVAQFGGAQALAWDTDSIETVLPELETMHDAALQSSGLLLQQDASAAVDVTAPTVLEARTNLENILIDNIVNTERMGGDPSAAYQALARYLASERERVKRSVQNLRDVCNRFAALEGSRHLVFVSQGIERVPGLNVVTRLQVARASSRSPLAARTESTVPSQVPRTEANRLGFVPMPLIGLDELRAWLAASGVTFHFLDAMPLGADLGTAEDRYASATGQRTNERRALEESALRMVDATGGISRLTPGDLKGSLDTFLDAAASTYRIGVRLTDVDTRKTYKVSVTVKKPGVTTLARSAYQPKGKATSAASTASLADQAAGARLKAAVDAKRPGVARFAKPPIPITALWKGKSTMPSKEPGKAFYKLEVAIPHDELRFNPEEDSMVASVRIVVEAKALDSPFSETFTDDLFLSFTGPEYKEARGTNATKSVTLSLPPGRYELAVTVNDALENRFGSAVKRVEAEE